MKTDLTYSDFLNAFGRLGLRPIDDSHEMGASSRIVHDLGIAGDDFDEIIEYLFSICGRFKIDQKIDKFIPHETSKDAYYLSMARSRIASKCRWIAKYYMKKSK